MKTYLINLDRSPDRLAKFHEANSHLSNVERFSAVDGQTVSREQLIRDGIITSRCRYSAGALGSAMSHISLWRKAVEEQQTITVAEDDAVISRNYAETSQSLLAAIPEDWDFIKWGWNFDAYMWIEIIPDILSSRLAFFQSEFRRNIGEFQNTETRPVAVRLLHSFGMVCYSITPKGARALLANCLPLDGGRISFPRFGVKIENISFDCAINLAYPKLKAFACMPPLAATENNKEKSTIWASTG